MKIGVKVYVIRGTEIDEYEIVGQKSTYRYKCINKRGDEVTVDVRNLNADTQSDIFYSQIIAYSTLEERLIFALIRTRDFIRKHRQKFHNTDSMEEFLATEYFIKTTDEEIQKEITNADYHEVYKEDELTDTQNE